MVIKSEAVKRGREITFDGRCELVLVTSAYHSVIERHSACSPGIMRPCRRPTWSPRGGGEGRAQRWVPMGAATWSSLPARSMGIVETHFCLL